MMSEGMMMKDGGGRMVVRRYVNFYYYIAVCRISVDDGLSMILLCVILDWGFSLDRSDQPVADDFSFDEFLELI